MTTFVPLEVIAAQIAELRSLADRIVGQAHSIIMVKDGADWVLPKRIQEVFGFTPKSLDGLVYNGMLLEGKHWKWSPNNRRVFSIKEFNAWLQEHPAKASIRGKRRSSSRSLGKASDTVRP